MIYGTAIYVDGNDIRMCRKSLRKSCVQDMAVLELFMTISHGKEDATMEEVIGG